MANFFDQSGGDGANLFDPGGLFHHNDSKDPKQIPNTYSDTLAAISKGLFAQTDPLRTNLINRSGDFLSGNMDVTASPMYGALKGANDAAFGRARDNTIANTAAGGGLTDALSQLEDQRAQSMTRGVGELAKSELDRATGLATGLLPIGTGGLGQAAGAQAQTNATAMQMQQQAQMQSQQNAAGVGSAIGGMMAK